MPGSDTLRSFYRSECIMMAKSQPSKTPFSAISTFGSVCFLCRSTNYKQFSRNLFHRSQETQSGKHRHCSVEDCAHRHVRSQAKRHIQQEGLPFRRFRVFPFLAKNAVGSSIKGYSTSNPAFSKTSTIFLLVLNSAPEISGSAAKPSLISTISGNVCRSLRREVQYIYFYPMLCPPFFSRLILFASAARVSCAALFFSLFHFVDITFS